MDRTRGFPFERCDEHRGIRKQLCKTHHTPFHSAYVGINLLPTADTFYRHALAYNLASPQHSQCIEFSAGQYVRKGWESRRVAVQCSERKGAGSGSMSMERRPVPTVHTQFPVC